jgi:dolichol-phosphate mannosyltransferase
VAVTIVVPVRNEAENVSPLIAEIVSALRGRWSYEIIYVDDGSTDATADRLAAIMKQRGNLRQIRHATRQVSRRRCAAGPCAVRRHCGDARRRRPEQSGVPAGFDRGDREWRRTPVFAAAGQRVGRKDTGFKKLQSRVANGVRNAILRDGTRDTGCGLKAFRREVFLMMPYFDGLHRFLPALMRREGYEIAYVDVIDRPRHSGVSNYGFFDRLWIGIMDLAGVWWLIRRKKPTPVATEVICHD